MLPEHFTLDSAQRLHSTYKRLGAWDFYPDGEILDSKPWHHDDYPGIYYDRFKNDYDIGSQMLIKEQDDDNGTLTLKSLSKWKTDTTANFEIWTYLYHYDDEKTIQNFVYCFECEVDDTDKVLNFLYFDLIEDKSIWINSNSDKVKKAKQIILWNDTDDIKSVKRERNKVLTAENEISKTLGYQEIFKQQLDLATDYREIDRIKSALSQNNRYILQQLEIVRSLDEDMYDSLTIEYNKAPTGPEEFGNGLFEVKE